LWDPGSLRQGKHGSTSTARVIAAPRELQIAGACPVEVFLVITAAFGGPALVVKVLKNPEAVGGWLRTRSNRNGYIRSCSVQ
jgi:hypothetical protein